MRRILLALMSLVVVHCTLREEAEPCFFAPTSVSLSATPSNGSAPLATLLVATARGRTCGCCGGKAAASILQYAWDLDGDGKADEVGSELSQISVMLGAGKHKIAVTVTDSDQSEVRADTLVLVE